MGRPSGTGVGGVFVPGFRCASPWASFLRSLRELCDLVVLALVAKPGSSQQLPRNWLRRFLSGRGLSNSCARLPLPVGRSNLSVWLRDTVAQGLR